MLRNYLLNAMKEKLKEAVVVQNLLHGATEKKIHGAMEIVKLSDEQKARLIKKGIIIPLISMLQSQDYIAIEASISALLGIACGSDRNKIQIVKSGITPVLLDLLRNKIKVPVDFVVGALLILSSCAANKLVIMSCGAIPILVELLAEDNQDYNNGDHVSLQAKLDAISTLRYLSTCDQVIPSIVSSNLVVALLWLANIHEKSSDLVEKAMGLLEYITSQSDKALLQTANTDGAIPALVEMIEEGTQLCKEHAVGILHQIGQKCEDKYRELILKAGVMPGLLQLSVDGTWRAKSVAEQLRLLLKGPSGCEPSIQSNNEIVGQVMQEIEANEENMTEPTATMVMLEISKLND